MKQITFVKHNMFYALYTITYQDRFVLTLWLHTCVLNVRICHIKNCGQKKMLCIHIRSDKVIFKLLNMQIQLLM